MWNKALALWGSVRILRAAFQEQQEIVSRVFGMAADVVQSPSGTPAEFSVGLNPAPDQQRTLSRNLFSTLFQANYHLLAIAPPRRLLYGQLNYLFRVWVTSADNLLDAEDKVTFPIRMAGSSRVMRQVVAIMAADRVLIRLLDAAVQAAVITRAEADQLAMRSLQVLLPSAAQEASEEGGITERPHPDYVLSTIHRLKTGLLFNIPFLGPEEFEPDMDRERLAALKGALLQFGIGCQILDDIRDMARDFNEQRHNYILSTLHWQHDAYLQQLQTRCPGNDDRLYTEVPKVVLPAARLAMKNMYGALMVMSGAGLAIAHPVAEELAGSMFNALDVADLRYAL